MKILPDVSLTDIRSEEEKKTHPFSTQKIFHFNFSRSQKSGCWPSFTYDFSRASFMQKLHFCMTTDRLWCCRITFHQLLASAIHKNFGFKSWKEKNFSTSLSLETCTVCMGKEANEKKVLSIISPWSIKNLCNFWQNLSMQGKAWNLIELCSLATILTKVTFPTAISNLMKYISRDFYLDWTFASRGMFVREKKSVQCTKRRKSYYLCECQSISR